MPNKKLRIAVFIDVYIDEVGGILTSVKAQKKYLEKLGHRVVVFCPGPREIKKRVSDDGTVVLVPVLPINIEGFPFGDFPEKIEKYILKLYPDFGNEFDVIHVQQEVSCGVTGVLLAKKFNLPLVHTIHGRDDIAISSNLPFGTKNIASEIFVKLQKKYIKDEVEIEKDDYLAPNKVRANLWKVMINHINTGDIILCPSAHLARKIKHYGVKRPVEVLSNGILDEDIDQKKIKIREFKTGEELRILWSSRVSKEKRIIPFLKSLALLKAKNIHLTVVGNGNQLSTAKRFIKEHKMQKMVEIVGNLPHDEVMEKAYKAHLLIMNSYGFDVQGMVLLEAQTVALPILYCDPDMKEIVPRDGGFFVKGPEIEKMTEMLEEILANPKLIEDKSQVMMRNKEQYLQSKQIEKLVGIYYKLVEKYKSKK